MTLRACFQPVDWMVLATYALFLLVIGFWRRKQDTESYLIADRNLGLPVFVATLVATWYGGILGIGEFVYNDGVVAWLTQGLPYYVFALAFALFLASRVRRSAASLYTIPDKLAREYDRKTALLGAAFAFIYASPAQYLLMSGTLLQILFGWKLLPAMVVAMVFSVAYVFRGGFLSDVRVNTLQFLLMFIGFLVMVGICLTRWGGLQTLKAVPPTHLHLLGTYDIWFALVWFFIALNTLTDPGFHQRCYAARTPRVAVVGILVAILCWMLFDALTTTTGLFARALLPHLADAKMSFPALAEKVLPPGIKGLFYVGMLAPIMASTVSYTFIAAMTVGRDFFWRLRAEPDNTNVPAYTRLGLAATAVLSIAISLAIPSIVRQWYAFGSVFVPGMLIPLLGAYSPSKRFKASSNFAFASMFCGAAVAAVCLLIGWRHGGFEDPHFPFGLQPMYPGLLVGATIYATGLLRSKDQMV